MPAVEQVGAPVAYHGEGPVWGAWAPGDIGLRYVDMLAGDVLVLDPSSADTRRIDVGTVAAAIRPRRAGGMVVATERAFALVSTTDEVDPFPELWSDTGVRFNDGATDPDGRFYCGTMAYDTRRGAGSMYRLDPAGNAMLLWDEVTISNGLAWSPDGATAYYIDTPTRRVDAFDYDRATGIVVDSRRTVVDLAAELADAGSPDGMCVDVDGGLWIAMWGGAAVRRYSPNGQLTELLRLPPTQVSACTFGGPQLDELYITTSAENLPPGAQPEAGALYRARLGVRGMPTVPFDGRPGSAATAMRLAAGPVSARSPRPDRS